MRKISSKTKILLLISTLIILSVMAIPMLPKKEFYKLSAEQRIEKIFSLIKALKEQQELSFTPEKKDPSYYFTKAEEICGFIVKNYNIEFQIYNGLPNDFDGIKNTFLVFTSDGKYFSNNIALIKQECYGLYNAGVSILKCNESILKAIDELPDKLKVFIGTKKAGGDLNTPTSYYDPKFNWIFLNHDVPRYAMTHELGHFIQYNFLPYKYIYSSGKESDWFPPKIQNNNPFKGKEVEFKSLFSIPKDLEKKFNTDGYVTKYSTTNSVEDWAETWELYMENAGEFKTEALRQYSKGKDLLWSKFNYILKAVNNDYSNITTPPFVISMSYIDLPEPDGNIISGEKVDVFAKIRTLNFLGEGYLLFVPYGNKNKVKEYLNSAPEQLINIKNASKGTYLTDTLGHSEFNISFPVKDGKNPEKSIPVLVIYNYYDYKSSMLMEAPLIIYSETMEIPVYNKIIFCLGDEDYIWKFYGNNKLANVWAWPLGLKDFYPDKMSADTYEKPAKTFGEGKKRVDMTWDGKNSAIWWYTSREIKMVYNEGKEYEIKLYKLPTNTYKMSSFNLTEKLPWMFPKESSHYIGDRKGTTHKHDINYGEYVEEEEEKPGENSDKGPIIISPEIIKIKPIFTSVVISADVINLLKEITFIKGLEEIDMKINNSDGIVWIMFKLYLYPNDELSYRLLAFDPENESIIKEITIPSELISPDSKLESNNWLLDPINNLIWLNWQNNGFLTALSTETGEIEYNVDVKLSFIKEFHLDPEIQWIWACGYKYPNKTGFRIKVFSYQNDEELEILPPKLPVKTACNPYDHSLWVLFYTGDIIKYDQDGNILFKKQVFVGQKKYFYNIKPISENGSVIIVIKGKPPFYPKGDYLETMYRYDLRRYSAYGTLEASSQNFTQTVAYTGTLFPSSDILGEQK